MKRNFLSFRRDDAGADGDEQCDRVSIGAVECLRLAVRVWIRYVSAVEPRQDAAEIHLG